MYLVVNKSVEVILNKKTGRVEAVKEYDRYEVCLLS